MTTFNFRGLPDCFVRMIRFFVLTASHDDNYDATNYSDDEYDNTEGDDDDDDGDDKSGG